MAAPPSEPLVSAVIPSYKPHFFQQCLDSILAQDYPNIEIIVSDDCPTNAIQILCAARPKVQYSRNPDPGHYANFDRCLALAGGAFIKFVFDDDVLLPQCVSALVRAQAEPSNPQVACMAACAYQRIDEDGTALNRQGFDLDAEFTLFGRNYLARSLAYHAENPVGGLTTVLLSSAARDWLGADYFRRRMTGGLRGLSDVALYFDLSRHGAAAYLSRPLAQIRESRFNLTNPLNNPNFVLSLTAWEHLVWEALETGVLTQAQRRNSLRNIARRYDHWTGAFPELIAARSRIDALLQERE